MNFTQEMVNLVIESTDPHLLLINLKKTNLIVPFGFHHSIPLPVYRKERLLIRRREHLRGDLVLLVAVKRLSNKLNVAVVPRFRARYRHRPAELDPRHRQNRTTVAVRKIYEVLLVVLQHRNNSLSNVINAYRQTEEF